MEKECSQTSAEIYIIGNNIKNRTYIGMKWAIKLIGRRAGAMHKGPEGKKYKILKTLSH